MGFLMDEEREKRAIQRIDEAFAKAEVALRQIRQNSTNSRPGGDPELAARHEQMRARTSEALTQLDVLISRLSK